MALVIAVPMEQMNGENRVSLSPDAAIPLVKKGYRVVVESNAGMQAGFANEDYSKVGAQISDEFNVDLASADVVLGVNPPSGAFIEKLKSSGCWLGVLAPHNNPDLLAALNQKNITSIALDYVPRISRAQKMDVLSSQANLAGYKSVLLGANALKKIFPLMMTAAGTITPAKVLIFGAGVAGLQAVATARRLGAVVEVTDVRPETKEQVESLGGRFLAVEGEGVVTEGGYAKEVSAEYLQKQKELVAERIKEADLVITTALVFGKKAPVLIGEEMVKTMKQGSVIVDMAVSQGGNCAVSEQDKTVEKYGVTIIGESNMPSLMARNASDLFGKNIGALLMHMSTAEEMNIDTADEIIGGSLITHKGETVNPKLLELQKP